MKIKRMVKRLFAVGAGATMLGATAMGALAADLSTYPTQFVTDGTFNGFFVVGERASATDNLAMTDIAASMKYMKPSDTSTTTVEGDAWLVGTSSKKLEMANNNNTQSAIVGENVRSITTFIGDDELDALADGTWATNEQSYAYQQFFFFDNTSSTNIVKYSEDDGDKTADYFYLANGQQIARYRMEFSSTAQSDVTDSTGTADTTGTFLDDFENTELSIMGKPYTVVLARRPASPAEDSVRLVLMAGAARDTLLEGESKSYAVGDKTYDVALSFIDSDEAKFTVNGEATNKLKVGETYVLSDKSEVGVSEILYQDYAGGIHSATFFVGAQKVELRDDEVQDDSTSSSRVKVGSEEIDGTRVVITGSDGNTTFSVSTIEVVMDAEDDFFVPANGKLSTVIDAAGEEDEVLFGGNWNVEYKGLGSQDTHELKLKTSSSRRYQLVLYDGDGNAVELPVAYAEAQINSTDFNITIGAESWSGSSRNNQKRLHLSEISTTDPQLSGSQAGTVASSGPVVKDDYFVVTAGTASDGSAKSYLLQYRGSDAQTKTSPKLRFKNVGSTETLEYAVTAVGAGATSTVATIKLGGYSFLVQNASTTQSDDFDVAVDLDGSGSIAQGTNVTFVDSYGSQWTPRRFPGGGLGDIDNVATSWRMTTPNADDYDNLVPSSINVSITATTDPELRAALTGIGDHITDSVLVTPDGVTEVSYGYTSMGSYITFKQPSSDPDEVTIEYPKEQRLPQVYYTSGAVTTSSTAGGDLTAVAIVDATKLDTEIADADAQNLVVVGGPCVNTVAAELLGNPSVCTEGFTPGKARVKLFEHANGKVAMLVAGYSGQDTRLAGKVIAHRWQELSGSEVEVEGTTYSDATIAAPSQASSSEETTE